MSCPNWNECFHEECCAERVCRNTSFWVNFWTERRRRQAKEQEALGVSIKEQRKIRKTLKKIKGIKRFNSEEKSKAFQEIYEETPPCTKELGGCDKRAACKILDECLVNIPRISKNAHLVNCLRGPLTLKQIISALKSYDPEPMKSYYRKNNV